MQTSSSSSKQDDRPDSNKQRKRACAAYDTISKCQKPIAGLLRSAERQKRLSMPLGNPLGLGGDDRDNQSVMSNTMLACALTGKEKHGVLLQPQSEVANLNEAAN